MSLIQCCVFLKKVKMSLARCRVFFETFYVFCLEQCFSENVTIILVSNFSQKSYNVLGFLSCFLANVTLSLASCCNFLQTLQCIWLRVAFLQTLQCIWFSVVFSCKRFNDWLRVVCSCKRNNVFLLPVVISCTRYNVLGFVLHSCKRYNIFGLLLCFLGNFIMPLSSCSVFYGNYTIIWFRIVFV